MEGLHDKAKRRPATAAHTTDFGRTTTNATDDRVADDRVATHVIAARNDTRNVFTESGTDSR